MIPVLFETCVVERSPNGEFLIALFDGSLVEVRPQECVALLTCPREAARSLYLALGSALIGESEQRFSENDNGFFQ